VTRRRPLRHVTFTLGVAITALLIATAALSLVYTPEDPLAMSITAASRARPARIRSAPTSTVATCSRA